MIDCVDPDAIDHLFGAVESVLRHPFDHGAVVASHASDTDTFCVRSFGSAALEFGRGFPEPAHACSEPFQRHLCTIHRERISCSPLLYWLGPIRGSIVRRASLETIAMARTPQSLASPLRPEAARPPSLYMKFLLVIRSSSFVAMDTFITI